MKQDGEELKQLLEKARQEIEKKNSQIDQKSGQCSALEQWKKEAEIVDKQNRQRIDELQKQLENAGGQNALY